MKGRTIAIGDVHGCDRALEGILDQIGLSTHDTLIQLGDLIDRGPESRAVVRRMRDVTDTCHAIRLLGNHEEVMLRALSDKNELSRWLDLGGQATLDSYGWDGADTLPRELITDADFLREGRDFFETETHIFVHAGYVADQPMDEQPALALRWRVTSQATAEPHCSGKTAIVGHTPQRSGEVLDLGFVKCIDTNCVRGGWLTALDVESGTVWQVDRDGHVRNS